MKFPTRGLGLMNNEDIVKYILQHGEAKKRESEILVVHSNIRYFECCIFFSVRSYLCILFSSFFFVLQWLTNDSTAILCMNYLYRMSSGLMEKFR